jgi:hypothetical protein
MFRKQFPRAEDAWTLAHAIIDTVREPLIVLDHDLRVVAASRSYYQTFKVETGDTQGKLLHELGDGQWDIPQLRLLLGKIVAEQGVMDNYEVERDFPRIGPRVMLLYARKGLYEKGSRHSTILLGIEDVTARRVLENEKDDLIRYMQFSFEFAQRLATIRSPLEFPSVIAEFTSKRIAMFRKHSTEIAQLNIKR